MGYLVSAPPVLAATLKGLRKKRRMTQTQAAEASGLQQKTISLLETHPHQCNIESLMRYLVALRVYLSIDTGENAASPEDGVEW